MNKEQRLSTIAELEAARGSRVITYLTGDRGIMSTPIGDDVLRIVYDHLRAIGRVEKIDLVLYSRGGDALLPWPLVTTLRSFCDTFSVLVPFRAHSAATLIALGADEIVMTPIAQLTPVEPTVTMPFNPPDPSSGGTRPLGVNVEDVAAYMRFVKDRGEIESETARAGALAALTSQIHPVALGHLHRYHQLARQQSEKLLGLHMDSKVEHGQISEIVENVVTKLWAHEYKIGREEARTVGLKAVDATAEVDDVLWRLFEGYEAAMQLRSPIIPATCFPPNAPHVRLDKLALAYVESTERTDRFEYDLELSRPQAPTAPGQPPQFGSQVQISVARQEWVEE